MLQRLTMTVIAIWALAGCADLEEVSDDDEIAYSTDCATVVRQLNRGGGPGACTAHTEGDCTEYICCGASGDGTSHYMFCSGSCASWYTPVDQESCGGDLPLYE